MNNNTGIDPNNALNNFFRFPIKLKKLLIIFWISNESNFLQTEYLLTLEKDTLNAYFWIKQCYDTYCFI